MYEAVNIKLLLPVMAGKVTNNSLDQLHEAVVFCYDWSGYS